MLTAAIKAEIATLLDAAGHGERGALTQALATRYNVSAATISRCRPTRKKRTKKRCDTNADYRQWVRIAVNLQNKAPKKIPLDLAIEGGIAGGVLPPEAAAMPTATAHRVINELQLNEKPARTHRLCADYPMQAIQIDGSSSEFLVVERELDDGDYLLKLWHKPTPASGYKNKPLPASRQRVLIFSVWDMCTGYSEARYYIGTGENGFAGLDFLCDILAERDNPDIPFHGVPDDLWSDQGAVFKSVAARDLLDRLQINLVTGEAYQKSRMGGVERTHRTRWARFERSLFLLNQDTIKLSELNARLEAFNIRENERTARVLVAGKKTSRRAAWIALTNGRSKDNPLRKLPANPIETMAKEARRKVDVNGIVRWGGVEYECTQLHACWVIARRGMSDTDDHIVVECERTGVREAVYPFAPRAYGEIVGNPKTELEKNRETHGVDANFAGADIYAKNSPRSGAFSMPTRSRKAAKLHNPLETAHYVSLEDAMRVFYSLYNYPLSAANRALVEEQIAAADCNKQCVIDIANYLLNSMEATQ